MKKQQFKKLTYSLTCNVQLHEYIRVWYEYVYINVNKLIYFNSIIGYQTPVLVAMGVVMQDPLTYSNPTHFNPDRFAEETSKQRPTTAFCPMGIGRRKCPSSLQVILDLCNNVILYITVHRYSLILLYCTVYTSMIFNSHARSPAVTRLLLRPSYWQCCWRRCSSSCLRRKVSTLILGITMAWLLDQTDILGCALSCSVLNDDDIVP